MAAIILPWVTLRLSSLERKPRPPRLLHTRSSRVYSYRPFYLSRRLSSYNRSATINTTLPCTWYSKTTPSSPANRLCQQNYTRQRRSPSPTSYHYMTLLCNNRQISSLRHVHLPTYDLYTCTLAPDLYHRALEL